MKKFKSLATLMLCISSAFGTSVILNTPQAKAEKVCSNRTLKGAYEIQGGGYLNKTQPYALNALNTFDGNGKVVGTVLVRSVGGTITTNTAVKGTYQVKSDCSFTSSFIRADGTSANYSGVLFNDGNKFGYTQTDPGTIVNLKGERVNKE
ncbi:MAG: hypothetical protein V7K48_01635 [Nostoc sp.]|uniref:hypothetical protein n=1 Tax=Nostoc sp. TaxID=1180 RepID=UPI002FF5BF6D